MVSIALFLVEPFADKSFQQTRLATAAGAEHVRQEAIPSTLTLGLRRDGRRGFVICNAEVVGRSFEKADEVCEDENGKEDVEDEVEASGGVAIVAFAESDRDE